MGLIPDISDPTGQAGPPVPLQLNPPGGLPLGPDSNVQFEIVSLVAGSAEKHAVTATAIAAIVHAFTIRFKFTRIEFVFRSYCLQKCLISKFLPEFARLTDRQKSPMPVLKKPLRGIVYQV